MSLKHAYLILAHNNFEHLIKLTTFLKNQNSDVFIHIDGRVPNKEISEIKKKLFFAIFVPRIKVVWGSYSAVEAEMSLIKTAAKKNRYSYFHLMSNDTVPIQKVNEIQNFFDNHYPQNFIGFSVVQNKDSSFSVYHFEKNSNMAKKKYILSCYNRLRYSHFFNHYNIPRKFKWGAMEIENIIGGIFHQNKLQKNNLIFAKGSAWNSITDQFVKELIAQSEKYRKLLNRTGLADEYYMQLLAWNTKFQETIYNPEGNFSYIRLEDWKRGEGTGPHIWEKKEIDELLRIGKKSNKLFVRKANMEDGLIDLLIKEFI